MKCIEWVLTGTKYIWGPVFHLFACQQSNNVQQFDTFWCRWCCFNQISLIFLVIVCIMRCVRILKLRMLKAQVNDDYFEVCHHYYRCPTIFGNIWMFNAKHTRSVVMINGNPFDECQMFGIVFKSIYCVIVATFVIITYLVTQP